MATTGARRVHFDDTAFVLHRWSGMSRYLTELIAEYRAHPELGVEPVTPYRFVSNAHLAALPGFTAVPLPRSRRIQVLGALNKPYARRADLAGLVTHYPLYDAHLLAEARAGRSVTTVYDFTFEVYPELFGDASAHLKDKLAFLEASDVLVCISESTRRDLHRFHPELDKPVVVTPLAVSESFAATATKPVRSLPERYLLHVGNRHEHKNLDLVMKAFRELAAADPTLHLVLTGQGLPGEQEKIAELGIEDRTHLVRLSDRALPAAYRHAAAFVFPSHYEGFGLPLLEAMTAGCPALISDAPALVEVAGDAAEVVGVNDVDAAVTALDRLVHDRAWADRRREQGRARAREFTWRRTAELTVEAYDLAARA